MAQPGAKLADAVHQELTNQLIFGGISKQHVSELSSIVADIYQQGLTRIKIFPKGKPAVDSIEVSGIVDTANLGTVLTGILTNVPRYTGVVIFPYGIINPELFQVTVQVGAKQE